MKKHPALTAASSKAPGALSKHPWWWEHAIHVSAWSSEDIHTVRHPQHTQTAPCLPLPAPAALMLRCPQALLCTHPVCQDPQERFPKARLTSRAKFRGAGAEGALLKGTSKSGTSADYSTTWSSLLRLHFEDKDQKSPLLLPGAGRKLVAPCLAR